MTSRTTRTAPTPLDRILARPLLALSLASFRREMRRARLPRDHHRPAAGSPDHLVFISDITGSGYGVVTHGLATPARTARLVAGARLQNCEFDILSEPELSAAEAARDIEAWDRYSDAAHLRPCGSEVAFVLLGVTDVLRMTPARSWSASLERIAAGLRCDGGSSAVVFAAIPPLRDFWQIPPLLRGIIERRIDILNAAIRDVVDRTPGTTYAAFPVWTEADVEVGGLFSWKAMHEVRARALAPLALQSLAPTGSFGS